PARVLRVEPEAVDEDDLAAEEAAHLFGELWPEVLRHDEQRAAVGEAGLAERLNRLDGGARLRLADAGGDEPGYCLRAPAARDQRFQLGEDLQRPDRRALAERFPVPL